MKAEYLVHKKKRRGDGQHTMHVCNLGKRLTLFSESLRVDGHPVYDLHSNVLFL